MGLTAPMAAEIRRLRDGQLRPPEIAELVGVSTRTVQEVLSGRHNGRPLTARERFEADAKAGWSPDCMDADEWADWRRRNPVSGIPEFDQVGRPCEECPLGWAADMRAEGRCNGTPGGVKEDAAGHEEEPDMDIPVIAPPQRRVDVALAAPCDTCIHAGICRIQPTLTELRRLAVALPAVDDAVTVSLSADVSCSHYTRAKVAKPASTPRADAPTTVADADRKTRILGVLERHAGDVAAAAAELGERPNVIARIRNAAIARGELRAVAS